MAIDLIPAMTGAEIRGNTPLPSKIAWLSCHFSPWNAGLSNLPYSLPEGSVLILDDADPFQSHDRELIAAQLRGTMELHRCEALLLDFQRPGNTAEAELAEVLIAALPFPVGVSQCYADGLPCPVFLPPLPPDMPLDVYLQPWQDREIWLDVSPEGTQVTLTRDGAVYAPLPTGQLPTGIVHKEESLLCHYTTEILNDSARFCLYRTKEDLAALMARAADLGVAKCFGLWQEWQRE